MDRPPRFCVFASYPTATSCDEELQSWEQGYAACEEVSRTRGRLPASIASALSRTKAARFWTSHIVRMERVSGGIGAAAFKGLAAGLYQGLAEVIASLQIDCPSCGENQKHDSSKTYLRNRSNIFFHMAQWHLNALNQIDPSYSSVAVNLPLRMRVGG